MATSSNLSGSMAITDGNGSKNLSRSFSVASTGGGYFATQHSATSAAATLSHGLATLRYLEIVNPSDSGATITVSMAPCILRPGDFLTAPPGGVTITHQCTGTATVKFAAAGMEV